MSFLCEEILAKCFRIKHYKIKSVSVEKSKFRINLTMERTCPSYCGCCSTVANRYDGKSQEFLIGSLNLKAVYADTKIYRVNCPFCGVVSKKHGIFDYFRLKVLQKCGYLMKYSTHCF